MDFKNYMQSLPNEQMDTIKQIAEITSSSKMSVYRWMKGLVVPPMVKQKIIADFIGKTVEELFPTKSKNKTL